jgi:hypothetical protein
MTPHANRESEGGECFNDYLSNSFSGVSTPVGVLAAGFLLLVRSYRANFRKPFSQEMTFQLLTFTYFK